MSPKFKYRLQPILDQKDKAKGEAERALAKANDALAAEKKKKEELEKRRAEVVAHIEETKRKRDAKAAAGEMTVQESAQYKLFVQGLENRRKEADMEIYKQDRAIERAAEAVEKSKAELIQRAKEFESMSKHRDGWVKGQEADVQKKEQKLMEEIGMVQFMKRKRGET